MAVSRRAVAIAGAGTLAWRAARAAGVARVGVLFPGPASTEQPGSALERLRLALRALGWRDGDNLDLQLRFDGHDPERIASQTAEFVAMPVDVIITGTTLSARIARRATAKIPIVMAVSADPVADGLVASLAQPGGNVTGLSIMNPELSARRLQLLGEMVPGLRRVGLLLDTSFARWALEQREQEAAGRALGLEMLALQTQGLDGVDAAFETARRSGVQGVALMQSVQYAMAWGRLAEVALAGRMPTVSGSGDRQFARAGGLMSYGVDLGACWARSATYVDRLLRGARPAELPVEQPQRFELALNRRTAQMLGLNIPQPLLLLADEVFR